MYTNECFGLWFTIPGSWQVSNVGGGAPVKATHLPSGSLSLLFLYQRTSRPLGNRIALMANPATDAATTKDFVNNTVQSQLDRGPQTRQLLHAAYPVDYAGKQFFRSDYKQSLSDGRISYEAFVFTKFRGYFVGESISAGSPEEMDQAVSLLQNLVFQQDKPNPNCVMGPSEAPSGLISGIISSTPVIPLTGFPQRVRISQGLSQSLILKKVQPEYPEAARQNHIEGSVVLNAKIDFNGNVQELSVISGDPALSPAAINAVKKWKYKPYLLNGIAVDVETEVTVIFTLQSH
jgi:TonB family protein